MRKSIDILSVFLAVVVLAIAVSAQQPGAIKPVVLRGDVTSIGASELVISTDTGAVTVEIEEKTQIKRVPAENPSLSAAVAAVLADIGVGDKLIVTGVPSTDRKRIPARAIYLMAKADIEKKQAEESREWATRGMSGRVASVDPNTGQITVKVSGLMGNTDVVVTAKEDAVFKQYAPNSVKYSETVPSSLANIQAGDTFRALGDRSADGLSFVAEEIVTGSFQTLIGTVKSVSADGSEIVVAALQDQKEFTVVVGANSTLKKFPEEFLARFAGGIQGQGPAVQRPAGGPPAGAENAGPGRPAARGGIDDMFERFPVIKASELTPGQMVAVSSTKNGETTKIMAIKLLSGVEPFVRMAQAAASGGGRGRGSQSGGFTIPGLDGFDFP